MTPQRAWIVALLLLLIPGAARSQQALFDRDPVLCSKSEGPIATVTGLAFSPDGKTLYAAGYDKVIHVWTRTDRTFTYQKVYRMPIGPGSGGVINALVVSPDGRWLAAGGLAVVRGSASFRQAGMHSALVPRLRQDEDMLEDEGTIYVFDTTGKRKTPQVLRGHRGPVLSMIFAPAHPDKPALLVSAARERETSKPRGQERETVTFTGRVRLWDVEKGKQLAVSPAWEDPVTGRPQDPSVAAWHTGKKTSQLAVAVALAEQPLRVWDATLTDKDPLILVEKEKAGLMNATAVFLPGDSGSEGQLVSGAFTAKNVGSLYVRSVANSEPQKQATQLIVDRWCVPYVLANLPGPRGKSRGLAMAVKYSGKSDRFANQYRLLVLKQGNKGLERVEGDVSLWSATGAPPALASSPDGEFLAVGGYADHVVRLYRVADLLAGKGEADVLSGDGVSASEVSFVKSKEGKRRGLRLLTGKTELVFDFAGNNLKEGADGWEADKVSREWEKVNDTDLKGPNGQKLQLDAEQSITAFASLPAAGGRKYAVLAVGYHERGVNYLGLYVPDKHKRFQQVRQLSGHVEPVRSLAFEPGGRLLASAAGDRRVCVWTLTDLDKSVGKCGMIYGLSVGKGLKVVEIDELPMNDSNSKAVGKGKLEEGDVIEQVSLGNKDLKVKSVRDYYEALWKLVPGKDEITLKIEGRKNPVTLTIDQGIEDHKPLFTLFVTHPMGVRPRWLAYSPHGYYDASDVAMEKRIEWQVNPAKHGEEVQTSGAGKYRKEYQRGGLVEKLARHGNYLDAVNEIENQPVEPTFDLLLGEMAPGAPDDDGYQIVREAPRTLHASVKNVQQWQLQAAQWQFAAVPQQKKAAQWQPDNDRWQTLDPTNEPNYDVDLGKQARKRGRYVVAVRMLDHRGKPSDWKTLPVRYVPKAPTIKLDADFLKELGERRQVEKASVEVKAQVTPGENGPDGPAVKVWVKCGNQKLEAKGLAVRETVKLAKGINVVEIVAENEGAGGDRDEQTVEKLTIELLDPKPPATPEFFFLSVTPEGEEAITALPKDEKELVETSIPLVRIRGRVRAAEPLSEVKFGDESVKGFVKQDKPLSVEIDVQTKVAAKKGGQILSFTARVGEGKTVTRKMTLLYKPLLPRLDPNRPPQPRLDVDVRQEQELRLWLTPLKDPYKFTPTVSVNDGDAIVGKLSEEDRLFAAKVKLQPGTNKLRITFANDFRKEDHSLELYVRQRPGIGALVAARPGKEPLTTLEAKVTSALPLHRAVKLNGEKVQGDRVVVVDRGKKQWEVKVTGVDLAEGKNSLQLQVSNDDGESEVRSVVVPFERVGNPPEIEMVSPATASEVEKELLEMEFRVRSETEATVVVLHDNKELPAGKPTLDRGAQVYRLTVRLHKGKNELAVRVRNKADTIRSKTVPVQYVEMWTVRVKFDGLQRRDPDGKDVEQTTKAPAGAMYLHGHVEYRNKQHLKDKTQIVCWVNDFRQSEKPLGDADGLKRKFVLPILLNRDKNQVVLQLPPELKVREDEPAIWTLQCAKPITKQRLHLLILGPGYKDQKKLETELLKAFGVSRDDKSRLSSKAFGEVILYGPLDSSDPNPQMVLGKLIQMRSRLRRAQDSVSDVVVVFFAGEERFEQKKHYLLMKDPGKGGRLDEVAVEVDDVRRFLASFQGAKLLLLDTHRRQGSDKEEAPAADPRHRLGSYRYVWLGKGSAPEDARLVWALDKAFSTHPVVKDQRGFLEKWANTFGERASFHYQMSPGLELLRLGTKTE